MLKQIPLFFAALISVSSYAQEIPTTIAILGCHNHRALAPTLSYLADSIKPDYSIWIGDNVYADTKTDATYIKQQLDILGEKKGFQALKAVSKLYITWDDHDYGYNNSDGSYLFKKESKAYHRTFWELEEKVPADQSGIYYAGIEEQANGKKIQFIMLDGRYNLKKKGRNADALGEAQWQWLKKELEKDADIRLIACGYQILLNKSTPWEAISKWGQSRKRLFKLINQTNAKGIVFITGDQHYNEVLRKKKAIGHTTYYYEIMASGINKSEKAFPTLHRVAGPDTTVHSAPLIRIYWKQIKNFAPHIHFTVTDVTQQKTSLSYRIFLSDIGI